MAKSQIIIDVNVISRLIDRLREEATRPESGVVAEHARSLLDYIGVPLETPESPEFPPGTPEYDAFAEALRAELGKFARGEAPYEYDRGTTTVPADTTMRFPVGTRVVHPSGRYGEVLRRFGRFGRMVRWSDGTDLICDAADLALAPAPGPKAAQRALEYARRAHSGVTLIADSAIMRYREMTGAGRRDAKDAIEAELARERAPGDVRSPGGVVRGPGPTLI